MDVALSNANLVTERVSAAAGTSAYAVRASDAESGREGAALTAPVQVTLSPEARAYAAGTGEDASTEGEAGSLVREAEVDEANLSSDEPDETENGKELDEEEKDRVDDLKDRDAEVRQHEQQHLAAAGGFATGGVQLEMTNGPDGKRYAVGGHVGIDTSPVSGDPNATIQKARTVRRAALAPADPSGADRAIAAKASRMETDARAELRNEQASKAEEIVDRSTAAESSEAEAPSSATRNRAAIDQSYSWHSAALTTGRAVSIAA